MSPVSGVRDAKSRCAQRNLLSHSPKFRLRLAQSQDDILAAQRLRYEVFVRELGGDGPLVDHEAQREADRFDPYFDHLLLLDEARGADVADQVVGVYRAMRGDQADRAGQFYSADEYNLEALLSSGKSLLELGRSCVHADYRGGPAMFHLWAGLADYVADHSVDVLFGVASFHGTDIGALAEPLSFLHHNHLAPAELRVKAHADVFQTMNLMPKIK